MGTDKYTLQAIKVQHGFYFSEVNAILQYLPTCNIIQLVFSL